MEIRPVITLEPLSSSDDGVLLRLPAGRLYHPRIRRRRRYRYAGVCGLAAVAYAVGVVATSVPTALLLGLFVPLSLGTELLLQARRSFCAAPGFRGRFDFGGDGATPGDDGVATDGGAGRVTDPAARRADRRYALRLTVVGVLVGAAGAVLVYAVAAALG